ncbi:sugar MFS transporter [uncultured Sphingomonas sp.]|uniref:sugar MFS transporter n=1 Tax=uncultured Sphingomonas sp. TaxID=158754 RepID=UPI0025E96745|nr:sugar MFS transporter [uncultured Sphingomonas sp.]
MALNVQPVSPDRAALPSNGSQTATLRRFVFALFFLFGGLTSLNDILIPKLRQIFTLDHATSMLVQSAFFLAYGLFSIPASLIVSRLGYLRTASLGLMTMVVGCLTFVPASANASFPAFLAALFLVGAGITIVQVVANPLISILGPVQTAAGRLTFAQAFNSLGTTIFPLIGSMIILGSLDTVDPTRLRGAALDQYRAESSHIVVQTYLALAAVLAVIAVAVWRRREPVPSAATASVEPASSVSTLLSQRFLGGVVCIFLYVGAEVTIGSLIVTYLMQADVLGIGYQSAGHYVPIYWGGALVGRFLGALLLNRIPPNSMLAIAGCGAVVLVGLSSITTGDISAWSLLAIGLANAVMFPTIFSLATRDLGSAMPKGSGIIATAIIGGAIIPYATGGIADATGSQRIALALPLLCYLCITAYGLAMKGSYRPTIPASKS